MFSRSLILCLYCLLSTSRAANNWIVPGAPWLDTTGVKIDAHGGMVLQRGDTFYWVGYSVNHNIQPYMYTSTDFVNWTPAKNPVSSVQNIWRPKIAQLNNEFWLYGQIDRNVQPLHSTSLTSNYTIGHPKTTLPPNSYTYSDTGIFHDTSSSTWYLLTSADHNTVQINAINPDGTIGARVNQLTKGAYEAPGLFLQDGIYFLVVSGKTGYRANPNQVFWTTKLNGGTWTGPVGIAPEAEKTYGSQNSFEFVLEGSKRTVVVYMGDSWDAKGGKDSNYVWLPLSVDVGAKKVQLEYHAQWKLDVQTGEVVVPSLTRRFKAAEAEMRGGAVIRDCGECVAKRAVAAFTQDSHVTFRNIPGQGGRQWVQIHYHVQNRTRSEAHISVNDGPFIDISALNHRAGFHHVVPVQLDLKEGGSNRIVFRFPLPDAGVVLEAIEVVED